MADFIVIIILAVILLLSVRYLIVRKKRGDGCCGCPNSSSCSSLKKCLFGKRK